MRNHNNNKHNNNNNNKSNTNCCYHHHMFIITIIFKLSLLCLFITIIIKVFGFQGDCKSASSMMHRGEGHGPAVGAGVEFSCPILRGGILMSVGNYPESLRQANLSREILSREIGRIDPWPRPLALGPAGLRSR